LNKITSKKSTVKTHILIIKMHFIFLDRTAIGCCSCEYMISSIQVLLMRVHDDNFVILCCYGRDVVILLLWDDSSHDPMSKSTSESKCQKLSNQTQVQIAALY
jgi:hypothetical protein